MSAQAVRELFWAAIGISGYQSASVAAVLIVIVAVLAIWLLGRPWLEKQLKQKWGPLKWTETTPKMVASILTTMVLVAPMILNLFDLQHIRDGQTVPPQIKVLISCDCDPAMSPIVMPADHVINWLQLNPIPAANGGGGLGKGYTAGTELQLTSSPHQSLYRCHVINHGSAPIFNVEMDLHLMFMEAIHDSTNPGATRSGVTTLVREWPISMSRIDVGTSGMFVFYISNASPQFAFVTLPEFVTFERVSMDTKDTARLMQPPGFRLSFSPIS